MTPANNYDQQGSKCNSDVSFGRRPVLTSGKRCCAGIRELDASEAQEIAARMPSRGSVNHKPAQQLLNTQQALSKQRRGSTIVETSKLLAECVQHGLRTLAFCKTRKTCELVVSYTREVLVTSSVPYRRYVFKQKRFSALV